MQRVECADELAELVRASNAHARDTYQAMFDAIGPDELKRLDLLVAQTPAQRVPVLNNGSNRYMEFASAPLSFNFQRFAAAGLTPDVFVVVPEMTNLLGEYVLPVPATSCLRELSKHPLCPDWLLVADRGAVPADDCVRAFDSHPSALFYWRVVEDIVRRIGGSTAIAGVDVFFRPYQCDLASRFSDAKTRSLFPFNGYLASESGDGQTGRSRTYRNPSAPNKQEVALIGDSHAFTAMSQLLSSYYESVTFFWANRVSGYGSCADAISRMRADHVIEESSERFLLSNFRTTWSASTRSA